MPTSHDTATQLRELAAAITAYPAQSADTQAALAWVRERVAAIAVGAGEPLCATCALSLARGVAQPARAMLN